MIFRCQTELNCAQIEERIEEDAKRFNLILKKHFPLSKMLPEAGFEIKEDSSVFELCKPSSAAKVLNTYPELNVLMPCRISVYAKDNICYASTPNLHTLLESLECSEEVKKEILDLYNNIITMIKGW